MTRVLVAGSFKYPFYDEACAKAFEQLGCEVVRFAWHKYYGSGLLARAQQRWLVGPGIRNLNRAFLRTAIETAPDLMFITRGVPLWPSTVRALRAGSCATLISNNNDDPFGKERGRRLWAHFVQSIPLYDIHFVFRSVNVAEYCQCGAKNVYVLQPYYVPYLHFPIELANVDHVRFSTDIVFVGHAKEDDRLMFLEVLARRHYNLRLYGWHWDRLARRYRWIEKCWLPPVWGLDYTRAIRAASVALVFYSQGNRDTYTSRSFEIPAIGTPMLSQRTEDMTRLFRDGLEAAYFSSANELLERTDHLLNDREARLQLAEAAMARLRELKASVKDRMEEVLITAANLRGGMIFACSPMAE